MAVAQAPCIGLPSVELEQSHAPKNVVFVPLQYELGEAFQFDWSCKYACNDPAESAQVKLLI
jgi:hypothetical protein